MKIAYTYLIGSCAIRSDKSSTEDLAEFEDDDEASSVVSKEQHEEIDDEPFEIVEVSSMDS